MMINRDNYELYILDFLDGKLSEEEAEIFARFLDDNPDIMEEVKNINQMNLVPEDVKYPNKNILKKDVKQESANIPRIPFGDSCIAYLEGDLSPEEMKKLEEYLAENPEEKTEFESFQKAYLKPDMNIVFPSKSKLKKLSVGQKRLRIISFISGAAAILVIALILFQPGFDYFNQLITERDADTESPDELAADRIREEIRKEEQTNKVNEQDIVEAEQEIGIAQVSTIESKKGKINIPAKEIRYENIMVRQDISLQPIASIQAHLEAQGPELNGILSPVSPGDYISSEEYLTIVEFASERLREDIFQKNDPGQNNGLTFWELAYNAFNGLDRISEGSYALNRDIDEEGSVHRIMFETPVIGLSVPLRSNKNSQ